MKPDFCKCHEIFQIYFYVYKSHGFVLPKITLFSRWSKTSTWKTSCQTYREASGGALYVFRCTFYISCSWKNSHTIGKRRHPGVKSAHIWWMPALCLRLPSSHTSCPSYLQGCRRRRSTSGPVPPLFCSLSSLLGTTVIRTPHPRGKELHLPLFYISLCIVPGVGLCTPRIPEKISQVFCWLLPTEYHLVSLYLLSYLFAYRIMSKPCKATHNSSVVLASPCTVMLCPYTSFLEITFLPYSAGSAPVLLYTSSSTIIFLVASPTSPAVDRPSLGVLQHPGPLPHFITVFYSYDWELYQVWAMTALSSRVWHIIGGRYRNSKEWNYRLIGDVIFIQLNWGSKMELFYHNLDLHVLVGKVELTGLQKAPNSGMYRVHGT